MLRTATTAFEQSKYPVKGHVRDHIFSFPSLWKFLCSRTLEVAAVYF